MTNEMPGKRRSNRHNFYQKLWDKQGKQRETLMIKSIRFGAFAAAAATALLVAPATSQAQETVNATFITGYAPSFTWSRAFIEYFAPKVDEKLAETGK